MKETVNISISGIGFIFDEDAYQALSEYLEKIVGQYSQHPDGKEIVGDIEARIVEIILSEQPAERVVERELIGRVIERMGYPDDIPEDEAGQPEQAFPKRLYRNREGAKLGGVFSGLATFFNADVVWFRLIFFLPVMGAIISTLLGKDNFAGQCMAMQMIFICVYILMWIVIPLAKTPRQRLEMYGREINTSTIEQRLKRDLEYMPRRAAKSSSIFSDIISVIGNLIVFTIKAILFLVGVFAGLFVVASILAIFYAVFHWDTLMAQSWDYDKWMDLVFAEAIPLPVCIAALFVLMIPALLMAIGIFAFIFKKKANRIVVWSIVGLWVLSLGFVVAKVPGIVRGIYMKTQVGDVLNGLESRGYYVKRDKAGNVTILHDTLLYAGEAVDTKRFYKRVNSASFRPEVELIINENPFIGGHMYFGETRPGRQLYESQKARTSAEGAQMTDSYECWTMQLALDKLVAKRTVVEDKVIKAEKEDAEARKKLEDELPKIKKDDKKGMEKLETLKKRATEKRENLEKRRKELDDIKSEIGQMEKVLAVKRSEDLH